MPRYTIKVPNNDEGEDLGQYEADYLPRVGDPFVLMHPRVSPKKDYPFCGVVSMVTHEANAVAPSGRVAEVGTVDTVVWLAEEHASPQLYCDCSEDEQVKHAVVDGACDNCGHTRHT
jgi:hypothetical protein